MLTRMAASVRSPAFIVSKTTASGSTSMRGLPWFRRLSSHPAATTARQQTTAVTSTCFMIFSIFPASLTTLQITRAGPFGQHHQGTRPLSRAGFRVQSAKCKVQSAKYPGGSNNIRSKGRVGAGCRVRNDILSMVPFTVLVLTRQPACSMKCYAHPQGGTQNEKGA